MKRLFLASLAVLVFAGCSSTNISDLTKELSTDSATVVGKVGTPYGTVSIVRTNPNEGQDVTIAPDGTVTITSHPPKTLDELNAREQARLARQAKRELKVNIPK